MPHGGKRKGAGRPKGKGPWGEETKPLRVPLSLVGGVVKFMENHGYKLPLYASSIPAGFPLQPADDIEKVTDLNSILLKNPEQCFLLRVKGDSMINACIHDGDLLIVDRSLEVTSGKIVVAMIDGQATVKRFKKDKNGIFLMPENNNYQPIHVIQGQTLDISGVVSGVVREL